MEVLQLYNLDRIYSYTVSSSRAGNDACKQIFTCIHLHVSKDTGADDTKRSQSEHNIPLSIHICSVLVQTEQT